MITMPIEQYSLNKSLHKFSVSVKSGIATIYEAGDIIPADVRGVVTQSEPKLILCELFTSRFTNIEIQTILDLAYTKADTKVLLLIFKLQTRVEIDLNSPVVLDAMNYIVQKGCITADRLTAIMV